MTLGVPEWVLRWTHKSSLIWRHACLWSDLGNRSSSRLPTSPASAHGSPIAPAESSGSQSSGSNFLPHTDSELRACEADWRVRDARTSVTWQLRHLVTHATVCSESQDAVFLHRTNSLIVQPLRNFGIQNPEEIWHPLQKVIGLGHILSVSSLLAVITLRLPWKVYSCCYCTSFHRQWNCFLFTDDKSLISDLLRTHLSVAAKKRGFAEFMYSHVLYSTTW